MRAVVTGGAGFIGSNLVDALSGDDVQVLVLDNLNTGKRENLVAALERGAQLEVVDVCDSAAVVASVSDFAPQVIFHLAAQIDVRKSVDSAANDARTNVEGTINLLEAARQAEVGRFVYVSTGGAIYGEAETVPTPEEHPVAPLAPYGQSKSAGEGYCRLYGRLHGLSTVSLRLGNVYGPRQDPLGEAGVIAIFCGKLGAGERPTVYGDGKQTRDYVYVGDVVRALRLAAQSDVIGEVNIGRGVEVSILDLVEILAAQTEHDFRPQFAPTRLGEVSRSALDCARAERELGWRAELDPVDGIAATLQ